MSVLALRQPLIRSEILHSQQWSQETFNLQRMLPSKTLNKVLLLARFILCAMPLTGYIHPDEFFQSPEVMAGDVLRLNTTRTWEWDAEQPIRSIIFPGISSVFPFMIIRFMSAFYDLTAYYLLILPRMVMTVISYTIDMQIEKISHMIYSSPDKKEDQDGIQMAIFLYRSSAVTLVFLTRTFSNSFEAALFAILLWLLLKHLQLKEPDKVSSCTTIILTAIAAVGFIIRPTFLLFVAFGAILYLVHLLKNRRNFILQMILGLLTLITVGLLAALADSLYFSWNKNFQFILTPMNLIKYNLNEMNLRLHGEHPRYLHLLVNCPLLFGPLSLVFPFATFLIAKQTYYSSENKDNLQPNRIILQLAGSLFTAVLLLSYFKHQEPRFLVPIISPMCLVSSWLLMNQKHVLKPFLSMWIIFNTVTVTWFGFVHQGGIIPSLSHLNNKIQQRIQIPCSKFQILFWYTYMAPSHLLAFPKEATVVTADMRNLGSLPEENITIWLHQTFNQKKEQCHSLVGCFKNNIWYQFSSIVNKMFRIRLSLDLLNSVWQIAKCNNCLWKAIPCETHDKHCSFCGFL